MANGKQKDTRSLDQLMADFSRKVRALETKVIALEEKMAATSRKADSMISASVAGQVLGGSVSEAKASAARANGAKGGRPRKVTDAPIVTEMRETLARINRRK
jgi:predicted  nucleic acid-binding Zn-ribbon protein